MTMSRPPGQFEESEGESRRREGHTPRKTAPLDASQIAAAVQELRQSEAPLRAVFENTSDAITILDDEGRKVDANRGASLLYGLPKEELLGRSFLDFISPKHREDARRLWREGLERGELKGEYEIIRADGECRDVEFSLKANFIPHYHLSVLHDITERKQAEAAVRQSEKQLFQFLEAVPVAIFVLGANGKPYYANKAAQHVLGRGIAPEASPEDLGEIYQVYIAGTDEEYPAERLPIVRALAGEKAEADDLVIHRPDGKVPLQVSASPIFGDDGQVLYAIAAFNDISDRRQVESILEELAVRDELTGLYNRRYMVRFLKEEAKRCLRNGHFTSLVLLDMDHFKAINDAHGHPAGDEVLRQAAQLIRGHIRDMDRAVRFGGEEMALILPETTDSGAFIVAERIRGAVSTHIFTHGDPGKDPLAISATISAGIACLPADAKSPEMLVAAADHALYEAKAQGRNRTVVFNKSLLKTTILKTTPLTEVE